MPNDLTPESLAELRRLLDAWREATEARGFMLMPPKEYVTLAARAVDALPALLDAAARLTEVEEAVRRGARCPMCSGPVRQTVGMVCQLCGADWSFDASSVRALAAESATTAKAVLSEALAVRAERDALRDDLADLREEVAAINQRRDDLDAALSTRRRPTMPDRCPLNLDKPCPTVRTVGDLTARHIGRRVRWDDGEEEGVLDFLGAERCRFECLADLDGRENPRTYGSWLPLDTPCEVIE